jgi:Zn-dependent metalloprotease
MRNQKRFLALLLTIVCANMTVFPTLADDDQTDDVPVPAAEESTIDAQASETTEAESPIDETKYIEPRHKVEEDITQEDITQESSTVENSTVESTTVESTAVENTTVESSTEEISSEIPIFEELTPEVMASEVAEEATAVYDVDTDITFEPVEATPVFNTSDEEVANIIDLNGGEPFATFDDNGLPNYIEGSYTDQKVSTVDDAISSLNYIHNIMGFSNAEQEFTEAKTKYIETPEEVDNLNHYRLQQTYNNIPVYGYQLIVVTNDNEEVKGVTGHYYPNINMEINPTLTMEEAKAIGLGCDDETDIVSDGLYIYVDDTTGETTLCWKIRTLLASYFIDANTGELVADVAEVRDSATSGAGTSLLNEQITFPVSEEGGQYILKDEIRNIYVYDADHSYYEKSTPIIEYSNSNWNSHPEAITAYANVIRIFDYYASVLGRNGANNARERINVYVNYRYNKAEYLDEYGQYDNAFYSTNAKGQVVFAIGDGNNISRALDVLAHEYTHAVDVNEWGAIYRGESGALDEAYADILGELIEAGSLTEVGEDMTRGSVRNFIDPSNPGDKTEIKQPSNYSKRYVGNEDYGGVHVNSGIINHAAYLIDQNWPTADHSIELVNLFYASMDFLTPNSTFLDCRNALYTAAKTMNMSEDKVNVILSAFQSVGIG